MNFPESTTLTVPDWILDQFGPRSREAAISFAHALLVCAGEDSPYLKVSRSANVKSVFTDIMRCRNAGSEEFR